MYSHDPSLRWYSNDPPTHPNNPPPTMHSQRPPPLKRSYSSGSHSSYASAATTVSRASSKLLFGEIPLTPATTADGRSIRSNGSICNLVLSTSSVFLRFWLNDACRDNVLSYLEPDHLSSFRLVCHDFSAKAAPRLFDALTVTFKTVSFTKPARVKALSRIGRHVKTFTFHMPHGPESFLPPIVDPETGAEKQFIYEPQMQNPHLGPAKDKTPKYGSWEMQDLLIKQYPPLFHAATNVPAFVAVFSELINLTHLKVSCPGSANAPRHRRSAVDYALVSLRIAAERAPLYSLSSLSLHPIHPGGLLYLHPMHGFGSTPSSAKRWGQIRRLSICMDSVPLSSSSARTHAQSLEHLRILHAYLGSFSRSLTHLFFRWKGTRGPSPLSLSQEPCMLASPPPPSHQQSSLHPSLRRSSPPPAPRALHFPRLRYMTLENAVMASSQIADFISTHRRSLAEFNFEDVKLRSGNWDAALAPLTAMAGSDRWKGAQEEVMDVPIMLSPVDWEPRVMQRLMDEVDFASEHVASAGAGRRDRAFSRWLGRSRGGVSPGMGKGGWGDRLARWTSWKAGGGVVMVR